MFLFLYLLLRFFYFQFSAVSVWYIMTWLFFVFILLGIRNQQVFIYNLTFLMNLGKCQQLDFQIFPLTIPFLIFQDLNNTRLPCSRLTTDHWVNVWLVHFFPQHFLQYSSGWIICIKSVSSLISLPFPDSGSNNFII